MREAMEGRLCSLQVLGVLEVLEVIRWLPKVDFKCKCIIGDE